MEDRSQTCPSSCLPISPKSTRVGKTKRTPLSKSPANSAQWPIRLKKQPDDETAHEEATCCPWLTKSGLGRTRFWRDYRSLLAYRDHLPCGRRRHSGRSDRPRIPPKV